MSTTCFHSPSRRSAGISPSSQDSFSAKNLELAKQRAMAVRAALVAAGVPEANIGRQPPAFVTGTGSDAEARRVEIRKQ